MLKPTPPEGYVVTDYRLPRKDEDYIYDGRVCTAISDHGFEQRWIVIRIPEDVLVNRDPGDETDAQADAGVFYTLASLYMAWRTLKGQVKALEETNEELADGLRDMTVSRDVWMGRHQQTLELISLLKRDLKRLGTELNEAWRRKEIVEGQLDQARRDLSDA